MDELITRPIKKQNRPPAVKRTLYIKGQQVRYYGLPYKIEYIHVTEMGTFYTVAGRLGKISEQLLSPNK